MFGFIVALLGCYNGFHSKGGAQGVGAATTNAVVSSLDPDPRRQLYPHLHPVRDMSIMANPTPKVELRGVKKRFGSKVVLDGVDLTIERGESLVVIGGSGTGKSVMIKCVLGILRPDEGQIFVDGEEVTNLRGRARDEYLRKFGMLFQGAALFDAARLGKCRLRADPGPRHARARRRATLRIEKLAKVGLGRRRRHAVAGGIVGRHAKARRPGARHRRRSRDHLLRRAHDGPRSDHGRRHQRPDRLDGETIWASPRLSITHDMVSARKISDRIAMLYKGKIVWDGPTEQIDHSGNPYVDQFIHGRAEGPIKMEVRA